MSGKAATHRRDTVILTASIACLIGIVAVIHYLFPPYPDLQKTALLVPGHGRPIEREPAAAQANRSAPAPVQDNSAVAKEKKEGAAAPPSAAGGAPTAAEPRAKAPAAHPEPAQVASKRPPESYVLKKRALSPKHHRVPAAAEQTRNAAAKPETNNPVASAGPSAAPVGPAPFVGPPAPAPSSANAGGVKAVGPQAQASQAQASQAQAGQAHAGAGGAGRHGAARTEAPSKPHFSTQAGIDTTPHGIAANEGGQAESPPQEHRRLGGSEALEGVRSHHKTLKEIWPSYIHATRVNVPIPGRQWVAAEVDSLKKKRFDKIVPQHFDYSCGAAAMATLLTYYFGRITSEKEAMKGMIRFGDPKMIRKRGFSLLDMQKYANEIGYRAGGYRVHLKQLKKIHLPLIVLINVGGRPHFVVLKGVRDGHAFVADPSVGNHVMALRDFGRVWSGTIFALQGPKDDAAPGLPLVAARPSGPDGQLAEMGQGFQFPLALDPARQMYINTQLPPQGILLHSAGH